MDNPTVKEVLERNERLNARKPELASSDFLERQRFRSDAATHLAEIEQKIAALSGKKNIAQLKNAAKGWRSPLGETIYVLGKGTATLLDLRVDTRQLRLVVNGPGMLFHHLELLTSLDLMDGYSVHSLGAFKAEVNATVVCADFGIVAIVPELLGTRNSAYLNFGLGPMNHHQSELFLETKTGEGFRDLIDRTLASERHTAYLAALKPVPGTGYHEGPADPPHLPGHPAVGHGHH